MTLAHILPCCEPGVDWMKTTAGRSAKELIVSSVLAKYNVTARTLYNYWLIATKTNDFALDAEQMGKALGIKIKAKLTDAQKADILSYSMSLNKSPFGSLSNTR